MIRYDHRDTGRSVTYEPGEPAYAAADLIADAAGILDAYGIRAAHVVGVSAGGGMAQELAVESPIESARSSSSAPLRRCLSTASCRPRATSSGDFSATAEADWSDAGSVIDYLVDYSRMLAGNRRPFDEAVTRDLVRRDVERARNFASAQNHDLLTGDEVSRQPLSSVAARTLVIHGTADPMFPLDHGEALADEIPDARLLSLKDAGHGIYRGDWESIVAP